MKNYRDSIYLKHQTPKESWREEYDKIWEARPAQEQRAHLKLATETLIESLLLTQRQEIVEKLKPFVERMRLDVDVTICDCGEPYKDSDLDLSLGELEKELSDLSERVGVHKSDEK
jgi:hypothetical protein